MQWLVHGRVWWQKGEINEGMAGRDSCGAKRAHKSSTGMLVENLCLDSDELLLETPSLFHRFVERECLRLMWCVVVDTRDSRR